MAGDVLELNSLMENIHVRSQKARIPIPCFIDANQHPVIALACVRHEPTLALEKKNNKFQKYYA